MGYSKAVGILVIACFWALASSASPAAGGIYDRNWPSEGMVSRWSGEGNARDSAGRHHGRVVGAVKYVKGVVGQAFKLDGASAYIHIGNSAALQITGNQTIAMWLNPGRLGVRQNPLDKAFGGELAITIEPGGKLSYYYGITGQAAHPNDAMPAVRPCLKVDRWTHIAVVRDFKARKLRCYINGVLKRESVPKFTVAKASSSPLYIGKGYTHNYRGLIDEVCIWNRALDAAEIGAVASSVPFVSPIVQRDAKLDSVRLLDGSVLLGTIEHKDWSITTSYGKFKIPAARVVGFLSQASARATASQPASSDVRMVLTDAQVLAGRLSAPLVRLQLPDGQAIKIPVAQIKQCAYRIGPQKPASAVSVSKADEKFPATVALSAGDHLAWDSSGMTIRFKSICGMLELPSEVVSTIVRTRDNTWRMNLEDSSVIRGTLASAELKLNLKLGKEISVPSRNVAYLSLLGVIAKPPDATTVLLRSGDRLAGKLVDKQLAVRTDYGSVNIPIVDIWRIRRHPEGTSEVTTQRSTVLRGKLTAGSLAMVLGAGVKLSVPVKQIDSIVFPRKLPAELVGKIEALIKELGDASAAKRKAAVQKLIAMGKDILVVLKRYSDSTNPAVSKGIKEVIDTLEGRVKPKPPIQWEVNIIDVTMRITLVSGNRGSTIAV